MDFDEIQQIFFQECEEALLAIETSYGLCKDGLQDAETINTIFRGVHSIKGGAGAFGHEPLQAFTHHYETLLDKLRDGALTLNPVLLTTLLAAFDTLSDHVAAARDGGAPPADEAVLARILAAIDGQAAAEETPAEAPAAAPAASAEPVPADDGDMMFDDILTMFDEPAAPAEETASAPAGNWRVDFRPGARAFDHGGEPMLLVRELKHMGGRILPVDLAALPPLDALDPEAPHIVWSAILPGDADEDDIRAVFDFISETCSVDIARTDEPYASEEEAIEETVVPVAEPAPTPAAAAVIPEPAIVAPVAATPAPAPAPAAKAESGADEPVAVSPDAAPRSAAGPSVAVAGQTIRVDLDKLDRLVNLVGELVITQAMLAQRLSAHGLANVAELTDLDHLTRELQDSAMSIRAQPVKTVFSRVPRIIRELESATGKRVRLEVEGEMTEVDKTVVERIGEPLTHLIRNAVDHGIEQPDVREAAGKAPEGVVRLSAEHRSGRIVISITDDGRGIDRERVRAKAIEKGIIAPDAMLTSEEIDNLIFAPGFSTAETLSNISGRGVGMDVVRQNVQSLGGRIGIVSTPGAGSTFSLSLPLTLAVLDGMIVRVGEETFVIPLGHIVESLRPGAGDLKRLGSASLLDVRGHYLPVQHVGSQLGVTGATTDPTQAVLIVVESDAGQAVLMVDAIQDQRQVVVKSLETNYRMIPGLAGATILGDGRVALILDVDGLVSRWRHETRAPQAVLGIAA